MSFPYEKLISTIKIHTTKALTGFWCAALRFYDWEKKSHGESEEGLACDVFFYCFRVCEKYYVKKIESLKTIRKIIA